MSDAAHCIELEALRQARVGREPYNYLVGDHFIQPQAAVSLREDFPDLHEPGFFPESDVPAAGSLAELLDELKTPEVSRIVSEKLDIDLVDKPRMITIRKLSAAKDGRIHTDGEAKIATMLVYLNESWGASGHEGCLRVLNGPKSFEDMREEISPVTGSVFAFRRADNSWHGHKPFVGERRVVQMTWLRSEEDVARKEKRGTFSHRLKQLFRLG